MPTPEGYELAMQLHRGELVWILHQTTGEQLAALVHRLPDGTFGIIEDSLSMDAFHQAIRDDELIQQFAGRSPLALKVKGSIFAYLLSLDDAERVLDRQAYLTAQEALETHESLELDINPDPDTDP